MGVRETIKVDVRGGRRTFAFADVVEALTDELGDATRESRRSESNERCPKVS